MSPTELKVLKALAEDSHAYFNFKHLSGDTYLDRKTVRRACRSLRRKGFTDFGMGLWTDDGEPAGSGYIITKTGLEQIS